MRFACLVASRSETRLRVVSWGFTAGSAAWLGPSRVAAITRLPPGVSAPVECILGRVAVVTKAVMCAHAVTVNDVLDGHVALDIQSLDRIYLNAYVPNLADLGPRCEE